MEEAVGFQPVAHRVGEAGQLDAVGAHDADAAELEALGEVEDGPPVHERRRRRHPASASVRRLRARLPPRRATPCVR